MRKQSFMYSFDELPLVVRDGIEAAPISGKAVVEYDREGGWGTGQVLVEGYGGRDATGKMLWVCVPAPMALAAMIVHRLENEWCGRVQEAVDETIAHDRECGVDDAADMRRDRKMGL